MAHNYKIFLIKLNLSMKKIMSEVLQLNFNLM
jgi:hypothetical protein